MCNFIFNLRAQREDEKYGEINTHMEKLKNKIYNKCQLNFLDDESH